jgi:hypothetical protein
MVFERSSKLLNGEHFDSPLEARVMIVNWVRDYNTLRPPPRPWLQDTRGVL